MHKHPHKTTEDDRFGEVFNVWSINKLFPDGDATDWRTVVGHIEEQLFGVDMATATQEQSNSEKQTKEQRNYGAEREAMRAYLADQKDYIIIYVLPVTAIQKNRRALILHG